MATSALLMEFCLEAKDDLLVILAALKLLR